ncbi:MAG: PQQ-binding-like beta-propeller repeat protein [Verrucomicrobiota bacterium]
MMIKTSATALLFLLSAQYLLASDWPQWRGPQRNGVSLDTHSLANKFPEGGPRLLWQSEEEIPSNDDGGFGSPIVVDGKVYLSVVWHRDVPTPSRTIDGLVMRSLGGNGGGIPQAVKEKTEAARKSRSPRLRGTALDEWTTNWIKENLTKEEQINYDWWVAGRIKKGPSAIDLADIEKIRAAQNKVFEDAAAFDTWLAGLDVPDRVKEEVLRKTPDTKKVANDVILCLDGESGKTLWKAELEGAPTGRGSASTPCYDEGRIYAAGSERVFCVDAQLGEVIWDTPNPAKGPASSPMVYGNTVLVASNGLRALDATNGKEKWMQNDVNHNNASPVVWDSTDNPVIFCNSKSELKALDFGTGEILWTLPGGGDSTPSVVGDHLAVYGKGAKNKPHELMLFMLKPDSEPSLLWKFDNLTRRASSSPIIENGRVHLIGGELHFCADLEAGDPVWKESRSSNISSPILADGKIYGFEKNASDLVVIDANADQHTELARAKVSALKCTSPAFAGGKLFVRTDDRIACYDLREN